MDPARPATTSPRPLPAPPVADLATVAADVGGAPVAGTLWVLDQLSRVAAFRLADGREVVVKARPAEPRLAACTALQAAAAAAGLPCPRPLGSRAAGGWELAVEEHRPGGRPCTVGELGIQPFVDLALRLDDAVGGLAAGTEPAAPPWADPLHAGADVWPTRDARLPDLRRDPRVPWLDDAAGRVRRRLADVDGLPRVGHLDLETHNLRWAEAPGPRTLDHLVSLDDWDSLGVLPQVVVVGQQAGTFTATRDRFTDPTVAQSEEFVRRWLATSGRVWSRDEHEAAWAAGLWTKLFNAQDRVVHRDAVGVLEHARPDADERLRLARA